MKPLTGVQHKKLFKDLDNMTDIVESISKLWDAMLQAEQIDVMAHLKAATKSIEKLDKVLKEVIKTELGHMEGEVPGLLFKAKLQVVPVDRLDVTALKAAKPATYRAYLKTNNDERITYEVR